MSNTPESAPLNPQAMLPSEDEPAGPLWIVFGLAVFASLFARTLFASLVRPAAATTQPAELPAGQTAFLAIIITLASIVAVVLGNLFFSPGRLRRLFISGLPRGLTMGIIGTVIALPVTFGATILTQVLLDRFHVSHPDAHQFLRLMRQDADPIVRGAFIFSAIVLAPLSEEMLFRGQLQSAILATFWRRPRGALAQWTAIVSTSFIFAGLHGEFWLMPPIFVLSLFLGLIYQVSGSLWSSIIIHAAFNLANVSLFLWQMSAH